jgi:threonine/homoserine/homoserine lactone efflux protein
VFTIAVFPQFLAARAGSLAAQAFAMWLVVASTQCLVYGGVAQAAGSLRGWLAANPTSQRRFGQAVGLLLVAVAAWALAEGLKPA